MDELLFMLNIDGKKYEGEVKIKTEGSFLSIDDMTLNIKHENCCIGISIMNNSRAKRVLSTLQVHLASLDVSGYKSFLVNPEASNHGILFKKVDSLKNKKHENSFLYSLFQGSEDFESYVIGFLSSHSSRNYIKFIRNNNKINIYAVYDFVNQVMDGDEKIILDDIYVEHGNGIFELFNNYSYRVKKSAEKLSKQSKLAKGVIKGNPFLARENSEGIILEKNKAVTLKVEGKRFYLADISKKEGREIVLSQCSNYRNTREYIYIENIMPYIEKVIKLKKFNIYREIKKTLELVGAETDLKFMFDDCPEGIAVRTMDAAAGVIKMEQRENIIKRLISKPRRDNLNYNFIIRTIFRKGTFINNTKFDITNKRIKQTMEIMAMSIDESKVEDDRLKSVIEDIDLDRPIAVHIEDDELFSIMRYGKESVYIAAFNFSDVSRRLYIDFSINSMDYPPDGMSFDIYTGSNYLISHGKIHIRNISPGDCCLIVKKLKQKRIINAL